MRAAVLKPLFTPEQIAARIRELATEIDLRYEGLEPVMVCVLKGAFVFFADLVRGLRCRPQIDFVRVASYGGGTSPQTVLCSKDVDLPLEGRHVILVDDIVDTGWTMRCLQTRVLDQGAASVAVAALVDKEERREVPVFVDFAGFALSGGFVVGYGLDYAEQYRELPGLFEAVVEE